MPWKSGKYRRQDAPRFSARGASSLSSGSYEHRQFLILVAVDFRFHRDTATGQPHIWNHDVDEEEVEEVLTNRGEDRPGRDGSRVAIGQTDSGRYLKVIYVRDSKPDSVFVVTAYELRGKPLLAYRKRERRKRQ